MWPMTGIEIYKGGKKNPTSKKKQTESLIIVQ